MNTDRPLKYPIGIQSFSVIIKEGYSYVDKTSFIPKLVNAGKYLFLSRPRRFGKSLLLSTLHAYFEGKRELFLNLEIGHQQVSWPEYPVIHLDLNSENYTQKGGLEDILDRYLRKYETLFGLTKIEKTLAGRFGALIETAHSITGKNVVILVDEYDKPLLGIERNRELFESNQATLKAVFGMLKTMDEYIHFAILTGVAKFNKVSIFSDLNNLRDITLLDEFADICGWTEEELKNTFQTGIQELANAYKVSYSEILDKLRYYYDGYLFAEQGHRLYNPFSVLNALASKKFSLYWFETGTPTFLAERVKDGIYPFSALNSIRASRYQLTALRLNDENPVPLLFQTGYLTIKSVFEDRFILTFPNYEVKTRLAMDLKKLYGESIDLGDDDLWPEKS